LEGTLQTIWLQPPCHEQGHLPPAQGAQSSIQPGLEPCQCCVLDFSGLVSCSGQANVDSIFPSLLLCYGHNRPPRWLHNSSVFFEIRVHNGRVEISLTKDAVMHHRSVFMVLFLWFISAVLSCFTFRLGAAV